MLCKQKNVVEKWQLLLLWYDQKWDRHVFHQIKFRVLDSGSISFGAGSEATVKTGVHSPAAISGWRRAVHGGKAHSLPIVQRADLKPLFRKYYMYTCWTKRIKTLGPTHTLRLFSWDQSCLSTLLRTVVSSLLEGNMKHSWDNYNSILKVKQQFRFGLCFIPKLSCRPYLNCPKGVRAGGGYRCGSTTRSFCVLLLMFLSL